MALSMAFRVFLGQPVRRHCQDDTQATQQDKSFEGGRKKECIYQGALMCAKSIKVTKKHVLWHSIHNIDPSILKMLFDVREGA